MATLLALGLSGAAAYCAWLALDATGKSFVQLLLLVAILAAGTAVALACRRVDR